MKEIKLSGKHGEGKVALVDDTIYEELNKWKWHAKVCKHTTYATTTMVINGTKKIVRMHRIVLDPGDGIVDHKDGNGLNNQYNNLRVATKSQNNANRHVTNGTSKYIGVTKRSDCDRWQVISANKNNRRYGLYKTEVEAALKYNEIARELHGEFATINIIKEEDWLEHERVYKKIAEIEELKKNSKKCSQCNEYLPFNMFCKDKHHPSGLLASCKACNKEARKKYKKPSKEKIQEYNKKAYEKHREARIQHQREYYERKRIEKQLEQKG